jgi:hypothetical protein
MNRNTHNLFYSNPEVQQLIQYGYMANPALVKPGSRGATLAEMIEYYLGGDKKVSVMVSDETYIADAEDPLGNADESSNYLVPDGKILFVYDLSSMGGGVYDFVYTPAIQNKTSLLDARPGPFLRMEDLTAPGSFGGLEFPTIKLLGGYNGMPRIKRQNDLIQMSVIF